MSEKPGPSPKELGIENSESDESTRGAAFKHWSDKIRELETDPSATWQEQMKAIKNLRASKELLIAGLPAQGLSESEEKLLKQVVGIDLHQARTNIDPEVGKRFDAHGIAKTEQLDSLVRFLDQGVDKNRPLHTLQLRRSDSEEAASASMGASGPYDQGGFIVVGKPDIPINVGGIALVALNWQYREAASLLARHYPGVFFATPEGLNRALKHLVAEKDSQK
jgi:hypothetical protein